MTSNDQDPTTQAESYGDYSVDDEDQPGAEDSPGDGADLDVADELDRGYSPPEGWSAGQGFGNTPYEEASGESFEQRDRQEEPDPGAHLDLGTGEDLARPDEQYEEDVDDGEVGEQRAGRLVEPDQGLGEDTSRGSAALMAQPPVSSGNDDVSDELAPRAQRDLVADDVGIDGAAASAEEAAVHVVPEDEI